MHKIEMHELVKCASTSRFLFLLSDLLRQVFDSVANPGALSNEGASLFPNPNTIPHAIERGGC